MTSVPVIDSHHHFWETSTSALYPWMTAEFDAIRRSFGPDDLLPLLGATGVHATILVQTRSDSAETLDFLALAAQTDFICGVIGWADLTNPTVSVDIQALRHSPGGEYLVGLRHQVHDEPDPDWLLRKDVTHGLQAVSDAGLVFDLLVRPREFLAAQKVAERNPHLGLVLDHIGKPSIRTGGFDHWAEGLERLAECPNLTCKLSGIITEADWSGWQPSQLAPYLESVMTTFGSGRVMFGSDWPVCLLAGSYQTVCDLCRLAVSAYSEAARQDVFGGNALRVYRPRLSS